jgi:integrase
VHRAWFNIMVWYPGLKSIGITPGGYRNGMHELRHTYASTLLAGGVDIRTLAEYLRHSDPGFTLRTYTYLMASGEERTRTAINQAFRGVATRGQEAQ